MIQSPDMPDPQSIAIIRAMADSIVPSVDGRPSAGDLGVHHHVADAIEGVLPGFVDLLAMLLDGYATDVRAGATFMDLSRDERGEVIRLMSREEAPDVRDMIDALQLFTLGGVYSEWTGYDRSTRALAAPAVWADIGYHGPVDGHPHYSQDPQSERP